MSQCDRSSQGSTERVGSGGPTCRPSQGSNSPRCLRPEASYTSTVSCRVALYDHTVFCLPPSICSYDRRPAVASSRLIYVPREIRGAHRLWGTADECALFRSPEFPFLDCGPRQ